MDYKAILGEAWTEDIEKALKKAVGEEFVIKSDFNTVKNELKQAKEAVEGRDKQLEELKKTTGDAEALNKQIVTLQAENKAKDDAHTAEIKQLKVNAAVEKALLSAKAKLPESVKPYLTLENAELLDDGSIKGLSEQIEKLVKDEKTGFLFETKNPGKFKGIVPGEGRDGLPGDADNDDVEFGKSLAKSAKETGAERAQEYYFGKN